MNHAIRGWDYLHALMTEYHSLVLQGYGATPKERSLRQIDLANQIITQTTPYLYRLARGLIDGYMAINGKNGSKSIISLQGSNKEIDEHVNEGALGIIKNLQHFDPNKWTSAGFVRVYAAYAMLDSSRINSIIQVPKTIYDRFKHVVYSKDKKTAIKNIGDCFSSDKRYNSQPPERIASAIYESLVNKRSSLTDIVGYDEGGFPLVREETISNTTNPPLGLERHHQRLEDTVSFLLGTLAPREEDITKKRVGYDGREGMTFEEIASGYGVNLSFIRDIYSRSIFKLRKPSRANMLRKFVE